MQNTIWFNKNLKLDDLYPLLELDTMSKYIGMEWVEIGPDFLKMRMPVDYRTLQPYGLLHGGASCALAETAGSLASHLVLDSSKFDCVGMEINANHVGTARSGYVTVKVSPIHLGRMSHVWETRITNEEGKLVSAGRLTVAVFEKRF